MNREDDTFDQGRAGQIFEPAPWFRLPTEVRPSTIPEGGLGVFALAAAERGAYLGQDFPHPRSLRTAEEIAAQPPLYRRFSWRYVEDACFAPNPAFRAPTDLMNHAFEPSIHCHIGHYFAVRDIAVGDELFVDYRFWMSELWAPMVDTRTGREVKGWPWRESLRRSCLLMADLMAETASGEARPASPGEKAQVW